jgi:esterase/lipase superfamily enzyme/uncharacterized protein YjbJ (UPF0337 family)
MTDEENIERTRAELRKAIKQAKDAGNEELTNALRAKLSELSNIQGRLRLADLVRRAQALNDLSDLLDTAIADIRRDIDNFLLGDLKNIRKDVRQKAGKPPLPDDPQNHAGGANPAPGNSQPASGGGGAGGAAPGAGAAAGAAAAGSLDADLAALGEPHCRFHGGVLWCLKRDGISIDGQPPAGTPGEPATVKRVWTDFGPAIRDAAEEFGVPVELIIATICTESRGKPDALREEPGFVSDQQTPNKVSPGLMQTLISTAREALGDPSIDRAWLLQPANSIRAGTAYIRRQRPKTHYDPPVVACAYNAGSVIEQAGAQNRWRMRQFPIGTGEHADRFVAWFNDCFRYFAASGNAPALSFYRALNASEAGQGGSGSVPPAAGRRSRFGFESDWDRVQGNWKQFKGEAQRRWGKLTDDELDQAAGDRRKLAGHIQARHGIAKDEAERQIEDWAVHPRQNRMAPPEATPKGPVYRVWYGTNRRPVDPSDESKGYSAKRDQAVHYGACDVLVPKSHKIGSVGSSWLRRLLTLTDDRLSVRAIRGLKADQFWKDLRAQLFESEQSERTGVVFIHGFNVSFTEAAIRAAQIGFDLSVKGAMAFFSWPSKGTLRGYLADAATIEYSEEYITDFLVDFVERSGAETVHLIVHSMGNRAALRAVNRIANEAERRLGPSFGQVILAAADIDADIFRKDGIAYSAVAERTTLYVSSRDRAVEVAHWLHEFPRAGLLPPPLVMAGIDTINVKNVDISMLGHGYIAEARNVLQDVHDLFSAGNPPDRRFGLNKVFDEQGLPYWEIGA